MLNFKFYLYTLCVMGKIKCIFGALAGIVVAFAIYFAFKSELTLVLHPKGIIAKNELNLITKNVILMLIILVPTFILILVTAWKYRANNQKAKYAPDQSHRQALLWAIPSAIVVIMATITWDATHKLDPYNPLDSEMKPLTIQVIALDWKWLFIYPEQEIATVNFVQIPEQTPIHFMLAADGSPMNSFWIPQLSGQIYCMAGMISSLHVMADGPGTYVGKAAEINGKGYAKMTFTAKSSSQADFEDWLAHVKKSSLQLNRRAYDALIAPSIEHPVELYAKVEKNLFHQVIVKYAHPTTKKLWENSFTEN